MHTGIKKNTVNDDTIIVGYKSAFWFVISSQSAQGVIIMRYDDTKGCPEILTKEHSICRTYGKY